MLGIEGDMNEKWLYTEETNRKKLLIHLIYSMNIYPLSSNTIKELYW